MRGKGHRTVWEPFDVERDPFEDLDWPESTLEVDDEEFARAIAAGRDQEADAA